MPFALEKHEAENNLVYLADGIVIQNCTFNNVNLFTIIPAIGDDGLPVKKVQLFSINNLFVEETSFNDSAIIFVKSQYQTTYPIELFIMQSTNMTLINNSFFGTSKVNGIELVSSELVLINLIAKGNNFSISSFIDVSIHVCTLIIIIIIINSSIDSTQISQGVNLFNFDLQQSLGYVDWDYYLNSSTVLLEERPILIINTTFSNIDLKNQSNLLYSRNPTMIFLNCSFINITLDDSALMTFDSYIPLVTSTSFASSGTVEEVIFLGWSDLINIYTSYRSTLAEYTTNNSTTFFYIVIQNVTFQNITSTNSLSLISASDINTYNAIVAVLDSEFSNVNISTDQDFGLIDLSEVNQIVLSNVSFQATTGDGGVLLITSVEIAKLTISSCLINNTQHISGYRIEGSNCGMINFIDNIANSIELTKNWMQIQCDILQLDVTAGNNIIFQDSIFSNV